MQVGTQPDRGPKQISVDEHGLLNRDAENSTTSKTRPTMSGVAVKWARFSRNTARQDREDARHDDPIILTGQNCCPHPSCAAVDMDTSKKQV